MSLRILDDSDLATLIKQQLTAAIDLDVHAQMVWGRHAADCTEHELGDVRRLMATPVGAGFSPIPDTEEQP